MLLYDGEIGKHEETTTNKWQTFINKSVRKIRKIDWSNDMSNIELSQRTNQKKVTVTIRRKNWKWIGHTLRKV